MSSLFDAARRAEVLRRVDAIDPGAPPRWGVMRAPQMLHHLTLALRMATGELQCRRVRSVAALPGVKHAIIYLLPFPRSVPTARELIAGAVGDWELERGVLAGALDAFGRRSPGGPWPPHPLFGALSGAAWGVLASRHIEHHLRQFGV